MTLNVRNLRTGTRYIDSDGDRFVVLSEESDEVIVLYDRADIGNQGLSYHRFLDKFGNTNGAQFWELPR